MHKIKITLSLFFCSLLFAGIVAAGDEGKTFDSEKMMSDLEKKIELSREQWEKLKPVLDEKSKELQQSMKESVDKGYVELEKLSKKLDTMTKDAEKKAREMLSSEEAQKLREYLSKLDEDAVRDAKERMVAELTALLELTEQQREKIKPVLEESMTRMSALFDQLLQEGAKNWDKFSQDFEQLTKDLRDSLQETLDREQMQKLEQYNKEQKEKIQKAISVV